MRLDVELSKRLSPAFALDVRFAFDLAGDRPVGALFGPSGCGKTTTLALIAGLLRADGGRVVLDGDDLARLPPERRGIGLVAQDGLLFPHLTVRGNLDYAERRAHGRAHPPRDRVLAVLRLDALLPRGVGALSGGERQRVALARALLAGPRLLLLDEPVSALDETLRFEALSLLEEVTRVFAVPAIYVSHHRAEVLRLASAVARMDGGRVLRCGAAAEILAVDDDAAGPLPNLLRVVRVDGDSPGLARLADRHEVVLPTEGAAGAEAWIRVPSGAIALELPGGAGGGSPRNRIAGRVIAVHRTGSRVRVAVDVGVALHADVTPQSAETLALAPGRAVVCVFKTHSLEVLP